MTHLGNMFIMYHTYPSQVTGKHEVIHEELSDLFPQLAQTWQIWGYNYWKPFGFLFTISRYRELFPDIGKLNSRYREIIFWYREINSFRISRNHFPISGIDFPISGNQFPISGIRAVFPDIGKSPKNSSVLQWHHNHRTSGPCVLSACENRIWRQQESRTT